MSNTALTEGSARLIQSRIMPIVFGLCWVEEGRVDKGLGKEDEVVSWSDGAGAAMSLYASARSSILAAMGP